MHFVGVFIENTAKIGKIFNHPPNIDEKKWSVKYVNRFSNKSRSVMLHPPLYSYNNTLSIAHTLGTALGLKVFLWQEKCPPDEFLPPKRGQNGAKIAVWGTFHSI